MNKNMELTLERGQSIEEGMRASQDLVVTSTSYRKTATKLNRTMCCRKYMFYLMGVVAVLVLVGVVVLVIEI